MPSASLDQRLDAAASAWRSFPVATQPRPLVLTGATFGLGTPATDETLRIVRAGLLVVDASVPAAAADALRAAGLVRGEHVDSDVHVTSAVPGSMGYSTDRGGRQLPSWFLAVTGIGGSSYVLDADSQTLAYPFAQALTVNHPVGGWAKLIGDGLTVRVDFAPPWLIKDSDPTSVDVDILETDAVVVFARRSELDPEALAESGVGEPAPRALTFRLAAPLGARVLCDVHGSPAIVARRKRPRSGR